MSNDHKAGALLHRLLKYKLLNCGYIGTGFNFA